MGRELYSNSYVSLLSAKYSTGEVLIPGRGTSGILAVKGARRVCFLMEKTWSLPSCKRGWDMKERLGLWFVCWYLSWFTFCCYNRTL